MHRVTQPCLYKWKYGIIHSEFPVFGVVCTTDCSASCERVFIHKLIKDRFILAHFLQWIDRLTPCLWDAGLVLWCSRLIIMFMLWALEYVNIPLNCGVLCTVWDCGSSFEPQILKSLGSTGHYHHLRVMLLMTVLYCWTNVAQMIVMQPCSENSRD